MSTARNVALIVALYGVVAVVPPRPFEKPLAIYRLVTAPAPLRVAIPVAGVAAARLRDNWGASRDAGARRHEGIDIFAARGTRVVAATDGIVSRVGLDPRGGRVVWVMGPARQMHYYAHLDRHADIRAGDLVRTGDVLGEVGTTGNAKGTPPHLHYGIYANGAIDPYPLLVPSRRAAQGWT